MTGIAFQPLFNNVMIELLAPKHAGEGLALYRFVFVAQACRHQTFVKFVRFRLPL